MVHDSLARGVTIVLAQELPSTTHYCRKDKGKERRKGRRGRRLKHLLKDFNGTERYWKLKKEALDRIFWKTRFGRNYGQVRETMGDPKFPKRRNPRCKVLNRHRRVGIDRQTDT
jgi:hypothetical protein